MDVRAADPNPTGPPSEYASHPAPGTAIGRAAVPRWPRPGSYPAEPAPSVPGTPSATPGQGSVPVAAGLLTLGILLIIGICGFTLLVPGTEPVDMGPLTARSPVAVIPRPWPDPLGAGPATQSPSSGTDARPGATTRERGDRGDADGGDQDSGQPGDQGGGGGGGPVPPGGQPTGSAGSGGGSGEPPASGRTTHPPTRGSLPSSPTEGSPTAPATDPPTADPTDTLAGPSPMDPSIDGPADPSATASR